MDCPLRHRYGAAVSISTERKTRQGISQLLHHVHMAHVFKAILVQGVTLSHHGGSYK